MKIPGWRVALIGAALSVMTVAGIGFAQAAPSLAPVVAPVAVGDAIAPAASDSASNDARLRPFRRIVHGTITIDHPKEGLITVQVDGGTISAVDTDSITIAQAGGTSVTIAIDDKTRVRLGGKRSTAADLKPGQIVRVTSRLGDANAATARLIVARPGA